MPTPEEKNPADELLKIPFSEVGAYVMTNQAISITNMQLNIRIIAKLEGRDEEDVKKEVGDMLDKNFYNILDKSKKTL